MAGSRKYIALLDTNVLFSSTLTDLFIRVHLQGVVRVRWSPDILEELARNLKEKRPSVNTESRISKMSNAVEDALITGYESLIPCVDLDRDKNDRHVLAAAMIGHCDTIVTFNLQDFPIETLKQYDIAVISPDGFLYDQLTLDTPKCLKALKQMLSAWKGTGKIDRLLKNLEGLNMLESADWIKEYREVLETE